MPDRPNLVDIDRTNLDTLPCCGIVNPLHPGRREKLCWMKANFKNGLRAKLLVPPAGKPCGYIEYIPGEFAWRGVDAAGYMFIHCVWMHSKQLERQGCGSMMVEACVRDAKDAGSNGVAVVVRDGPWLAGPQLFLANGFRFVEAAPPDYQLLALKFNPSAADPAFKGGWDRKLARCGRGLTIIRSGQCPYVAKFTAEIAQAAEDTYGIRPRIVEWKTYRDAQNAPTPYAVFAIVLDGRLLADHQISRTRFRNIMNKCPR